MKKYFLISFLIIAFPLCASAIQPTAITDLISTSTVEGMVNLQWTVPNPGDGVTPSGYVVKYAAGDIASSDFNQAWATLYNQSWTGLLPAGSKESRTLSGFPPSTTIHFAIKAYNGSSEYGPWHSSGETGGAQNPQDFTLIYDTTPSNVTGVKAVRGNAFADISWTANPEPDIMQYVVEHSSYSSVEGFTEADTVSTPATSYHDTPLVNGNEYYFRVKAVDNTEHESGYSTVVTTVPWAVVGNPTFNAGTVAVSTTVIAWQWNFASNALLYNVINSSSGVNISGDISGTTNYFLLQGLTANTSATVYVQAINGLLSANSVIRTVYSSANPPSDVIGNVGASIINLSWSPNGNSGCTRYCVQRSTDSFSHSTNVMSLAPSTTCQDSGLNEGTTFQYRIWAVNEDSFSTQQILFSTFMPNIPPAAPVLSTVVSGAKDGEISVQWVASGDDGTNGMCSNYVISWASYTITEDNFNTIGVSSTIAATVLYPNPEPVHTIGGLFPGTTFWVAMRAVDDAGNFSLISNTKSVVSPDFAPQTPKNVSVTALNPSSINVSWGYPDVSGYDDRDYYKIYRATFAFNGAGPNVITSTRTHPTGAFVDSGLDPKTTYYYRISTLDKGDLGNGLYSTVLESPLSALTANSQAYTPDWIAPSAITQLSAAPGVTEGKINLSWTSTGDDYSTGTITGGKFRIDWDVNPAKNFTTNTFQIDITTTTSPGIANVITANGLGEGVTYYFRIWTMDGAGNWSAQSANAYAWSQYDVTPPAAVSDLSAAPSWRRATLSWSAPGDDGGVGTLNGFYDIRMSSSAPIDTLGKWNAVSSSYPYRVNIATQVAASTPETITITGLTNNVTYYFALRSCDERGNWSAISTVSPSTAPINLSPSAPVLSQPSDLSITQTLGPTFVWNSAADPDAQYGDAITYTVSYSTDNSFPAGVTTTSTGNSGTSFTPTLNFSVCEDKTVYWKVWAVDTGGLSTPSATYFRIRVNSQNSPPASFTLISPAVGITTNTATPQLSWNSSSDVDPGDVIRYRVEYSSTNFVTFISTTNIAGTSFQLPSLIENATYWWRVYAIDGTTETVCTAPFYFRVNSYDEPPAIFNLLSPSDNQVMNTSTITFTCQPTIDPDPGNTVSYEYCWSTTQDFASSTTAAGQALPSVVHSGFVENGVYYWKVVAVGSCGQRRFSTQTWRFYVDCTKELPASFELLDPGYNVTISTTVTPLFSWTKAIDPDPADDVRYIFDLSLSPDFPSDLRTQAVDRGTDRYYQPLIGLSDQTTYYWRVRASGYQGNPIPVRVDPGFMYSSTGVFVISMINNPPDAFSLSAPANHSTLTSKKPTFSWTAAHDRDVSSVVTYTLLLSTCSNFSVIIESASLLDVSYTVNNTLKENRAYYWRVWATDNKNAVTNANADFSFTVPILNVPCAPTGLCGTLADNRMSFTVRWSPVIKNSNGTSIDDLAGYHIYRGLSDVTLSQYAVVSSTAVEWVDANTQGGNFFYRVRAFDTSGIESASEDSPLINSLSADTLNLLSDDHAFSVAVPAPVAQGLLAQNNDYHEDLSISFKRDVTAENDTILASYLLDVTHSNGTSIEKYSFESPLVLTFSYGARTPAGARLAALKAVASDTGNLNIFWNNGVEYIRLGGVPDSHDLSVSIKVTKPGLYQLRRVSRPSSFRVAGINPPKVFTPGIAPYEKITFYVDNPDGDKVTGKIFDLRSENVGDMRANGDPTSSNVILEWDGSTSDSGPARKGVYIYQIEGSGKILNGTIIVAR